MHLDGLLAIAIALYIFSFFINDNINFINNNISCNHKCSYKLLKMT